MVISFPCRRNCNLWSGQRPSGVVGMTADHQRVASIWPIMAYRLLRNVFFVTKRRREIWAVRPARAATPSGGEAGEGSGHPSFRSGRKLFRYPSNTNKQDANFLKQPAMFSNSWIYLNRKVTTQILPSPSRSPSLAVGNGIVLLNAEVQKTQLECHTLDNNVPGSRDRDTILSKIVASRGSAVSGGDGVWYSGEME